MVRTVTLRIRADDAPELVPSRHRWIGEWIVEATLTYEEAQALFLREKERRNEGRSRGITWFTVHNAFTEREIAEARWFHAWSDRSHHRLVNRDDGELPDCPVCGIAMAVELCPMIPASPLPRSACRSRSLRTGCGSSRQASWRDSRGPRGKG